MKKNILKTTLIAVMTLSPFATQAAVEFHPITCADEQLWIEKLGTTALTGLTLVPEGSDKTKFTMVDFSPYHNNSITVAGRQVYPMVDTTVDDNGNFFFYTKPYVKTRYHRGGMMFKFVKVEDNVYDMSMWLESGKPVNGHYEFGHQKPLTRATETGTLRMKITEDSLKARAAATCK